MSLEAAIHQRWANDATLILLAPPVRLFTGAAVGKVRLPYVVVTPAHIRGTLRGSDALQLLDAQFEFRIWAQSLAAARQLAEAIRQQFDASDFALEAGSVRNLCVLGARDTLDAQGLWQCVLPCQALIER